MPTIHTAYFGAMQYGLDAVLTFPQGLPGFEQEREFLPINQPASYPLTFLQSVKSSTICFLALPVLAVDQDYRLGLSEEELIAIGFQAARQPAIGSDVLCLSLISITGTGVTANLLSPLVINLKNRLGVQAIQSESAYSYRHLLQTAVLEPACS